MISDARSAKIALIAHCILNQNAVVQGLAKRPAMIHEVVEILNRASISVIQLPCPETMYLGLRRFWHVKEQYSAIGFRRFCRKLARQITDLVSEYLRNGYKLTLILGIAGSPSCGIFETISSSEWFGNPSLAKNFSRVKGRGVFMEELISILEGEGLLKDTLLMDFDYSDITGSLKRLRTLLKLSS